MPLSKAEKEFTHRFPHTRVEETPKGKYALPTFKVFAGDYLCAESYTRTQAFAESLRLVDQGLITPDPHELSAHARL